MKILFATNNAHKLAEVSAVLGPQFTLTTPREAGIAEDIPEDQPTLEGNALQKARYIHARTGLDCFADDAERRVSARRATPPTATTSRPTTGCCSVIWRGAGIARRGSGR